jgi:hypothetical protein
MLKYVFSRPTSFALVEEGGITEDGLSKHDSN